MKQIWYALRCELCEIFSTLAIEACPKGYTPSFIQEIESGRIPTERAPTTSA